MSTLHTRTALAALVCGMLSCTATGLAHADETVAPTPLDATQEAAATRAAASEQGLDLARQLADGTSGETMYKATKKEQKAKKKAKVKAGTTTQVHVITPEFVANGTGTVASLDYVANSVDVDGRTVTVWTVPTKDGKGWQAVNAASGTVEAELGKKAKNGILFTEPQIGAWYVQRGNRIMPLNDAATQSIGKGASVAEYQKLVHDRYADKLAGSQYDKDGMAGGYNPTTATQAAPATMQASDGIETGLVAGAAAAVALGGAGVAGLRARRKA